MLKQKQLQENYNSVEVVQCKDRVKASGQSLGLGQLGNCM